MCSGRARSPGRLTGFEQGCSNMTIITRLKRACPGGIGERIVLSRRQRLRRPGPRLPMRAPPKVARGRPRNRPCRALRVRPSSKTKFVSSRTMVLRAFEQGRAAFGQGTDAGGAPTGGRRLSACGPSAHSGRRPQRRHWSARRQFGRGRIGGGPRAAGIAPDDTVQHAGRLRQLAHHRDFRARVSSFKPRMTSSSFRFHDLTQVDGRFYTQGQQVPVTSTFVIPRQWFIFSGRLTKPFEYFVADRRRHRQSKYP